MASKTSVSRPRRRDRVTTRAALLRAAAEVFSEKGLAAATLDEISERAGFSRGAFHHHFASKHELFLAVIAQRDEQLQRGYESIDLPPDIRASARKWHRLHASDEAETLLRLELRLLALRDREVRRRFRRIEREAIAATTARLIEAAARQDQTWRHPPDRVAVLLHLMSGALRNRAALGERDAVALMESFQELVWAGALEPSSEPATRSSTT